MSKIQQALDKIKAQRKSVLKDSTSIRIENFATLDPSSSDTPFLAAISAMQQPEELSTSELASSRIIDSLMPDRQVFNAFRELRTTIIQRAKQASPVIMILSCTNNGGASFVSLNLAAAISMDEAKTSLLVDCNLAQPSFTSLPIKEYTIGLKDYLSNDNHAVNEIIYPTGVRRMRVIPAGLMKQPIAEHFTSVRLRSLFDEIKERYEQRYIIVDAPPISQSADARILAEVCDYVVLVVPYGKVEKDQLLTMARAIGKDKLLGTVINNEPRYPKFTW